MVEIEKLALIQILRINTYLVAKFKKFLWFDSTGLNQIPQETNLEQIWTYITAQEKEFQKYH